MVGQKTTTTIFEYKCPIAYFINESFDRQKFHLECNVFNEKQTAINIIERVIKILIDWGLIDKVTKALRDSAANMVAAFESDLSNIEAFACLLHLLQLVINEKLLQLASVKAVVEKCRRLSALSNQSNNFHHELRKQQQLHFPGEEILCLIQDVVTRSDAH